MVFQNPALLGSLTVEENVGFLLKRSGRISDENIHQLVMKSLEDVGLYDVADKFPGELSGGMQKRVSFARALINDPYTEKSTMPLLLYDEPTAGLDWSVRNEVLNLMSNLAKEQLLIVVTHEPELFTNILSSTYILDEGKLRHMTTLG